MHNVYISDNVRHSGAEHGGAVLVDVLSGRCYAINPTAHAMWQAWRGTGKFETAIAITATSHPELPAHRIHDDARRLALTLADRGLVVLDRDTQRASPRFDPPGRTRLPAGPTPATRHRAAIPIAVGLALLLARLPFKLTMWVTRAIERRCRRWASPGELATNMVAVRRATRWWPGRVACLEQSLATVLATALTRSHADLVIGVADDPHRFHAWVEADGVPVSTDLDVVIDEFRRILVI